MKCKGKNKDGTPCNNWALQNSYYCQLHQNQETAKDRQNMKESESIASIVILAIFIFGFLISLALGCEREFIDWLGR